MSITVISRSTMGAPPLVPIVWGKTADPACHHITVEDIMEACGRVGQIRTIEMRSARRDLAICRHRQAAMYLARQHTSKSFPALGRMFGRDHTTVMKAAARVQSDLDSGGGKFGAIVAHVERELGLR